MSNTQIEEVVEEETTENTGKYTHGVSPPENHHVYGWLVEHGASDPTAEDIVKAALEHGWEIKAVCGYVWIPTSRGENFDACPICMDVMGMHIRNAGE